MAVRWQLRRAAGGHRLFLGVLAVAVVLRAAATVAYPPALLWSDSWAFLGGAYERFPFAWLRDKPMGYPLVLRPIGARESGLLVVPVVQHLIGLGTGAVLYALLLRQGIGRTVSALAAGVVLLDSYAIALEQHVLSESVFTMLAVVWAACALRDPPSRRSILVAGLALGIAALVRPVALVVIPVWVVYALWAYRAWRRRALAVLATIAPLLVYIGVHGAVGRGYALSELDGFTQYARVAQIGSCAEVRQPSELQSLCPPRRPPNPFVQIDPVDFYQWSSASPVYRDFGDPYGLSPEGLAYADDRMRRFAVTVIASRPAVFAGLIARETVQFFEPGVMSYDPGYDEPILFPTRARPVPDQFEARRRALVPGYVPTVRWPAAFLATYQRWIHSPRWLLGLLYAAACAALLVATFPRARPAFPHRRAIWLLSGGAGALLVGGVLNHFEVRYAIPAVPLLIAGGVLAVADLRRLHRALHSSRT